MSKCISKQNGTINNNINDQETSNTHPHTINDISVGKVVTIIEEKIEKPIKKESKTMYNFGKRSRSRLDTCHPDIIKIMEEAIKVFDFSVLEGIRTTEKQQEYFETGRSKLDGIHKLSKHQDHGDGLSHAIDIMPYKKGTNAFSGKEKDKARFYYLAGLVKGIASKLLEEGKISHKVRWGGDWDSDDVFDDQNFDDLPHFELKAV